MVSLNSIKVWFKALVPLNPSKARRLKDFARLREKFFLIKTKQ